MCEATNGNPKFKVGDIVELIEDYGGYNKGYQFRVSGVEPSSYDKDGGMINGLGTGTGGVFGKRLRLVGELEPKEQAATETLAPKFQVGDKVRVIKNEVDCELLDQDYTGVVGTVVEVNMYDELFDEPSEYPYTVEFEELYSEVFSSEELESVFLPEAGDLIKYPGGIGGELIGGRVQRVQKIVKYLVTYKSEDDFDKDSEYTEDAEVLANVGAHVVEEAGEAPSDTSQPEENQAEERELVRVGDALYFADEVAERLSELKPVATRLGE